MLNIHIAMKSCDFSSASGHIFILALFCFQVFVEEWLAKGVLVEEMNQRGTALENLIIEITAPDAQSKTGRRWRDSYLPLFKLPF